MEIMRKDDEKFVKQLSLLAEPADIDIVFKRRMNPIDNVILKLAPFLFEDTNKARKNLFLKTKKNCIILWTRRHLELR